MHENKFDYWGWLKRSGPKRYVNGWVLLHLAVGLVLTLLVRKDLETAANSVLLPLVGILIGLSFAWAGNAQALLQTAEMQALSDQHEDGFPEYVYVYQTAILLILATLVLWGLAGLGVFDAIWPATARQRLGSLIPYKAVGGLLFAAASATLRECWHAVMGASWMLIAEHTIRNAPGDHAGGQQEE